MTFADLPMGQIRPSHVQQWVKAMSHRSAPTTVRTRFNYVHICLRAAVTDRIIKADPSAAIALPRVRRAAASMTIPTTEDVGAALSVATFWFRPFVAVCAIAGLRLGRPPASRLATSTSCAARSPFAARSRARTRRRRAPCRRSTARNE